MSVIVYGQAAWPENKMAATMEVTPILHRLGGKFYVSETVGSAHWRCPNSTVALRLLENVAKVTNLEVVKIEFHHLS